MLPIILFGIAYLLSTTNENQKYKKGGKTDLSTIDKDDVYVTYYSRFRSGYKVPLIYKAHNTLQDAEETVKSNKDTKLKIGKASEMPTMTDLMFTKPSEETDKAKDIIHSKEKVDKFFENKDSFYKKNFAWVKPTGYTWDNWQLVKK